MQPLLLRTVQSDGTPLNSKAAATGFKWPVGPDAVGQTVTAPDWDPNSACGGGLHGLLWGQGEFLTLNQDAHLIEWQVVEVAPGSPVVDLGGKVKTQSVIIRYSGPSPIEACAFLKQHRPEGIVPSFDAVGDGETATVGDCGCALAGKGGTAITGEGGYAAAGDGGTATAGVQGKASAGAGGTATVGAHGYADAGPNGTAIAGDEGFVGVQQGGKGKVGKHGIFAFLNNRTQAYQHFYIDGVGIRANIFYKWSDKQQMPVKASLG